MKPAITYTLLAVVTLFAIITVFAFRDLAQKHKELSAHYVEAGALVQKLNGELEKANAIIAKQNTELTRTEKARKIPVKIGYRRPVLGSGAVMEVYNTSDHDLPVLVKISNATFPEGKKWNLVINAGSFKEIGHMQGWSVAPGDVAEFSSEGYDPSKTKVQQSQIP